MKLEKQKTPRELKQKVEKVKQPFGPKIENVLTYRLALVDSQNNAVQIDTTHSILTKISRVQIPEGNVIEKLLEAYELLLATDKQKKDEHSEHDKQVTEKLTAVRKIKQEALAPHKCPNGHVWRGGSNICPECGAII